MQQLQIPADPIMPFPACGVHSNDEHDRDGQSVLPLPLIEGPLGVGQSAFHSVFFSFLNI